MGSSEQKGWMSIAGVSGPLWSGRRVLVAEDDPAVRRMVERVLVTAGHGVRAVASAGEALDAFWLEPRGPDVLLLDVGLPDGNGRELARHLTSCRPDLAVVLMSGDPTPAPGDLVAGGRPPVLLRKPFSTAELLAAIESAPKAYTPPAGDVDTTELWAVAFE